MPGTHAVSPAVPPVNTAWGRGGLAGRKVGTSTSAGWCAHYIKHHLMVRPLYKTPFSGARIDPPAFNCSSSMPPVDAPGASPAATQYALRPVAAARSPWRGQGRRLPAYSHNPLTTGISYSRMCVSTNFKGASWMPYMDKSRLEYPAMFTGSACPPSLALWEQRVGGDGRAHPATPLALAPAGARARGGPEGQACLRL